MKKSILIITYGREKELYETLVDISKYKKKDIELLILDNNDSEIRQSKVLDIFKAVDFEVKYYNDNKNYGVALGRNYLIKKAKGDILITFDDDISIPNINILISRIESYFLLEKNVGALAFNIKNYYTKENLNHELPHGNKKLNYNLNLSAQYFIGAAHAIKKEVYNKCGIYPDYLGIYGGEEEDLSYRILLEYKILYCSDLIIYHKNSILGRVPLSVENYYRYRNKLVVRKRYLSKKYFISNFIIWSFIYLFRMKGKINDIFKVKKDLNKIQSISKNKCKKLEKKLKEIDARLLY